MIRISRTFVCIAFTILITSTAVASPILELVSTDGDGPLGVGRERRLALRLSGLPAGTELDGLYSTIVFDGASLQVTAASVGSIVPNPLDDPEDFVVETEPGIVDAAFLTLGPDLSDHIFANGEFLAFQVRAIAPGVTTLSLDFLGATQFNSLDPENPTEVDLVAGAAYAITVIPEPSTGALLGVGVLLFEITRRQPRRRGR